MAVSRLGTSGQLLDSTRSVRANQVYDLGIPLFDHLRIYLAKENKWLDIHAEQNYSHFNFVKECRLDQTSVSSIQHQDLLKAEQLTFTLSWLPNHS